MANLAKLVVNLTREIASLAAVDIVGVYTAEYTQVFARARPLKATVKEDAKLMEHPLENGASVIDHKILLPIEIELSMILQAEDYRDTYQQIKQIYVASTLLSVQTRTDVYKNQVIASMPHEENPEMFDAIVLALKLREVQFAKTVSTFAPRNVTNTSTVQRGNLQPKAPTPENTQKSTNLFKLFS